jgi:SAM-dependent methyltransferase
MTLGLRIINPKPRRVAVSRAAWYKYYPCFSEGFADAVLRSARLKKDQWVLDPWNGSGTTTSKAQALGHNSYGYDLNPAMLVVAKARSLSAADYPSLGPLLADICRKSLKSFDVCLADPLLSWLVPDSVSRLRGIEAAIQRLLIDDVRYSSLRTFGVERISDLAAFFYVALFRTLRRILESFFPSNPTWIKRPRDRRCRVRPDRATVSAVFRAEAEKMLLLPGIQLKSCMPGKKVLAVASSESLPLPDAVIDLVLSSPPYCTRIDYAVATSVELAALGYAEGDEFGKLRRALIGNTTVPREISEPSDTWGPTCLQFLSKLYRHSAKASSTYYYKNHFQYFRSIHRSLSEASRVLRAGGLCVLVVQDSYYKNIHNDLPRMIIEMGAHCGLPMREKYDFPMSRTMAGINPRAGEYRSSFNAVESVVVMSKSEAGRLSA